MTTVNKSAFWIIFTVVFIDLVGFGIVFPLLPLYTRQFQMDGLEIGLVLGIYSLMQFLFAPVLGRLSDKIGRRPVLLVSMLGTALSFFLLAISNNFWWFLGARALDGIAGSNLATAQAYIADISPKEQRTRNLGMWIGAAFGLGFAFGPFLGGVLHWAGQALLPQYALAFPFMAAGALALLNWFIALFKLPESLPYKDSEHKVGARTFSFNMMTQRLSGPVGLLIAAYAIIIFAFAQMEGSFSWVSRDVFNLDDNGIYWVFGYLGLVMAFVQGGLVRRLAPKLGDKKLAVIGCTLTAAGLALLPLLHSWVWLLVTSGLFATGESLSNPALMSSISKGTDETLQGETMGVAQSLASLSRFGGPALAGYLYSVCGSQAPYYIGALIMLLALGVCLKGYSKLETESLETQPVNA